MRAYAPQRRCRSSPPRPTCAVRVTRSRYLLRSSDAAGLAVRVYGGALPASPAVVNSRPRAMTCPREAPRRRGGRRSSDGAARRSWMAAHDDSCSCRSRSESLDCTIITHQSHDRRGLSDHAAVVFIVGGQLFKPLRRRLRRAPAEAAAQSAPTSSFWRHGVHPDAGLTTGDPDEAAMKRALAARAGRHHRAEAAGSVRRATRASGHRSAISSPIFASGRPPSRRRPRNPGA